MTRSAPFQSRAFAAAILLLTAAGCADDGATSPDAGIPPALEATASSQGAFKVYSQNAYLGGDTDPIFSVDFSNLPAVIAATNRFWAQVQASRIPERAAGMVDEIERQRPHLVGLQEVTRFVVRDMAAGGAVVGGADLLASIMDEIGRRGLPYEIVRTQENSAVTLPLSPTVVLQTTDRLAVLRRRDVDVTDGAQGTYAARFTLGPVTLKRGWIRVTAEHEGTPYHVVTTHLETQRLAPVQAGQAAELIGGVMAGLEGVTVLTGDLNSDAAHPGAPSWTPTYDAVIAAGFTDAWERSGKGRADGYTCCQASDLRNPVSELDERIDFVLLRDTRAPGSSGLPGSVQLEIVGEESGDLTAQSGLWRADHAGLVATLRLPKGLAQNEN